MNLKNAMKAAKATKKIQTVNEPESKLDLKVSLSLRLDPDVLTGIKEEAESMGLPYQTYINSILKRHLKNLSLESRIESLEKKLKVSV